MNIKKLQYTFKKQGKGILFEPNLISIGLCFKGLRKYQESLSYFLKSKQVSPNSICANNNVGQTYCDLKQCKKAIPYLQFVQKNDSTYPLIHFYLGLCYSSTKCYQQALRQLLIHIQMQPNIEFQLTCEMIAVLYQALGKQSEAKRYQILSK